MKIFSKIKLIVFSIILFLNFSNIFSESEDSSQFNIEQEGIDNSENSGFISPATALSDNDSNVKANDTSHVANFKSKTKTNKIEMRLPPGGKLLKFYYLGDEKLLKREDFKRVIDAQGDPEAVKYMNKSMTYGNLSLPFVGLSVSTLMIGLLYSKPLLIAGGGCLVTGGILTYQSGRYQKKAIERYNSIAEETQESTQLYKRFRIAFRFSLNI